MPLFAKATSAVLKKATIIEAVSVASYPAWLKQQSADLRKWLGSVFKDPKGGQHTVLPKEDGSIGPVIVVLSDPVSIWDIAALPLSLPEGLYQLQAGHLATDEQFKLCLGFGLGSYQYTRYKKAKRAPAQLVVPTGVDSQLLEAMVAAQTQGRDLINTPAEDLGPPDLAAAASQIAKAHNAKIKITNGDVLRRQFPLVHAVGRAGPKPPQLIDISWGKVNAPKVTLVGKGVCYDTGGLNIKTQAMFDMKKDMGGAASVLTVAQMIMASGLNVRLRVIIPAVENSISGQSIRPSDIVTSRAGVTVEIENTDAEGRLILADALALAAEDKPDLIIDMATLTGAKYALLGRDIGAIFSNRSDLAQELQAISHQQQDPLWQIPIWEDYSKRLDSVVADTMSCAHGPYADPILAALFLQKFIGESAWLHIDLDCDNATSKPGRPEGGETQAARAVFSFLQQKYGRK